MIAGGRWHYLDSPISFRIPKRNTYCVMITVPQPSLSLIIVAFDILNRSSFLPLASWSVCIGREMIRKRKRYHMKTYLVMQLSYDLRVPSNDSWCPLLKVGILILRLNTPRSNRFLRYRLNVCLLVAINWASISSISLELDCMVDQFWYLPLILFGWDDLCIINNNGHTKMLIERYDRYCREEHWGGVGVVVWGLELRV